MDSLPAAVALVAVDLVVGPAAEPPAPAEPVDFVAAAAAIEVVIARPVVLDLAERSVGHSAEEYLDSAR